MKGACRYLIVAMLAAAPALAGFTPTSFLQTDDPSEKMCQHYVTATYGDEAMLFVQPSGGAMARIHFSHYEDYVLSIFCDQAFNKLFTFHFYDQSGVRTPKKLSAYGKTYPWNPEADTIYYIDSITPPPSWVTPMHAIDSVGYFFQPVDVALSATGQYFRPDSDFVYVLDQGNRRVVIMRYDMALDSLVWVYSFSQDSLVFPTAIDY